MTIWRNWTLDLNAVSFSGRNWIENWWNWMPRWRKWAGKPILLGEKLVFVCLFLECEWQESSQWRCEVQTFINATVTPSHIKQFSGSHARWFSRNGVGLGYLVAVTGSTLQCCNKSSHWLGLESQFLTWLDLTWLDISPKWLDLTRVTCEMTLT